MHISPWVASVGAAIITGLVMPFVKDAAVELYKKTLGRRGEESLVKVAEIEAAQGREVRVSAEIWDLVDALKGEVEDLRQRLESSEQRNAVQAAEIEQLQARLKQFETLSKENTALRNKVKKLQTALAQAQAELQGRRIGERTTTK